MKKICIIISASLLLVSCDWVNHFLDKKVEIKNEFRGPESIKIKKEELFTKSLFVKNFYQSNNYFTVWIDSLNRVDLLDAVLDLENDGINPNKFDLMYLVSLNNNYNDYNMYEKINADIEYTNAFLRIVKLLAHGKVNPNKFYSDWVAPQKEVDFNQLLITAISEKSIGKTIQDQIPTNPYYRGIKKAIAQYKQMPKDTLLNLKSSDVSKIKMKLNYLSDANFVDFNSVWDEESKDALKKFQKRHGLVPSGNLNSETLLELNVSKEKRLQQLCVNLERARWFYKDLGKNYVLVNLPEAELFLYENGELTEKHKVIIGKKERPTPILSSTFNNLIVNPTWTVPPTILKNDMVPKAIANRGYFENYRITIFDRKGKVVSPTDWNPDAYKNYRYVQKPGTFNALGLIKFNFPNDHIVYLHDTNNKSLFANKKRDLSSGCVRVQNPFDLAMRIIEIEGIDLDRTQLDTIVAKGKTKTIPLKKEVNVHQLYWTAWNDDNQGVQFRNDIYSLDDRLYKKLTN